jgi:hypothetical protein
MIIFFYTEKTTCWCCPGLIGPKVDIHELEKVRKKGVI